MLGDITAADEIYIVCFFSDAFYGTMRAVEKEQEINGEKCKGLQDHGEKELLKAVENSRKSYEEIMAFLTEEVRTDET